METTNKEVIKPNVHGIDKLYNWFKRINFGTDVTSKEFKNVLRQFNSMARDEILKGETLDMGHHLSIIRIRKIERSNLAIDWGETKKLKLQGINKKVYYTDPYYYRWYWNKGKSVLKNRSVYSFHPTSGETGNKKRLARLLNTDEFAHLNFKP